MNYLITGGCGFIGSRLIKVLCKEPNSLIRVIDNLSVGEKKNLHEHNKFKLLSSSNCHKSKVKKQLIINDIRNKKVCLEVTRNIDVIIHLAANTKITKSLKNPFYDFNNNLKSTLNLLEGCKVNNVKRFVFASSAAIGGNVKPPINEEIVPKPISPYGASKLGGEAYCSTFYETFNIETIILRFGNVYGPGSLNKTSVVSKFIKNIIENKILTVYGDGDQTRDYIYIDDIISAINKASKIKKIGGHVFQIATDKETSVNELVDLICKKMKSKTNKKIKIRNVTSIKGEMLRNFSDTSKARKILKWQARKNLNSGLDKTIDYFLKIYNK